MSKFQLYIDNQRVELFDNESVSLTQTIQNIRDISKVFTDFTKPFTLPASSENNKIFKHYYRLNLATGYNFDARKKVDAKIELNSIPFREGKIRLEGVDLKKGKPDRYRVTFFGNTVNLGDTLKDNKINSLTWLNNFNLDYDASTIESVLTNPTGQTTTVDSVQYTAAVIVPLISNTVRLWYDSSPVTNFPYLNSDEEVNVANGGNLYPTNVGSETANDVHGVYFEDLTYAIKVHLIVKAIEDQYPTIKFSDDFFDLTNGPEAYQDLYMLCQNKEGRVFEDLGLAERLITGLPTTQSNHIITNDSRVIIYNLNIDQTVLGTWSINTGSAYPTFTVVLREGSETVLRRTFLTGTNTVATFSQQITNSTEGYNITIETETAFNIADVTFVGIDPSGNTTTAQTSYGSGGLDVTLAKEFIISQNLPNMQIIDFLTGLFKMFNLTAFQQDGIIHVKTLESFYTSGTVRDITEFVDPQTIQVDKALPYEEIEFKYKDTGAIFANQHDQLSSTVWGGLNYTETGGLDSNPTKYDIEVPFAHLKYERLYDPNGGANSQQDVQWGWMANENDGSYFEDPVLFIGQYVSLPSDIRFLQTKSSLGGIRAISDIWIPSNSVSRDATTNKETIHFGLELNEWTEGNNFTESLFEKYYRFYIAGVFNQSKRLTKITARLPKKFVVNYTLADVIVINDNRYRINSITTNLLTGQSQLELLNETVNDTLATQPDSGGGEGGQPPSTPTTNVLTLYQCDSPNNTFESTQTLATLNLAINTRVEDGSGNTYRVTGNNVPSTHTSVSITSTGLTGCPSTPTTPTTNYYGLERCSDNASNFRTATEVGNPTYAITQQVFDGSNVKYIIANATAQDTVPSVTIASTPSPAQFSCGGNVTTYYYQLNPCCSGTTFIGFSANSSLSGTRVYNNQTYVISPASNTGTIDIDSLPSGTCQVYYYTLNDCANQSTIEHYGYSNCSNLNGTELTYNSTCYHVVTTSNTTATVNLDSLSSCTCAGTPPPPATEYYLLQHCDTNVIYVTTTTTNDITLTQNASPSSASLVTDSNGICYTVNSTTTDPSQYTNQIGAVSSENQLGCPATPCTQTLYYQLLQCATNSSNYITSQTTLEVSYNVNDMVQETATPSQTYKVLGTTTSGTSVIVSPSALSACPTFYELRQCYTLQGSYRSDQDVTAISLSVNDRVQAPDGMPYTVVSVGVSGGGYANVGTVTDTGQTGCPTINSNTLYYSLQRCSDSVTGFLSLQTVNDISLNNGDVVGLGGASGPTYQVVGTGIITSGTQIGAVTDTGNTNCITPVVPPVPPPATTNYATFITCDDPAGATISVYSTSQISTWWVISEVGSFECYRWQNTNQGVNPIELNNTNFNFFTTENTAGANCIDCNNQAPPPPPPPPPPAPTCFQVAVYKSAISAIDLCSQTQQRTVNLNASTLGAASQVFTDTDCTNLVTLPQWFSETTSGNYWYWNGSSFAGPYTQNCP